MHATLPLLQQTDFPDVYRSRATTVQVNLGYLCNQQCLHCHVNAGPNRKENMTRETVKQVMAYLASSNTDTLDLTGGAPELNPNFRDLVTFAHDLNIHVIDRCNLTVLEEKGQEDLADFLAKYEVEITASLPCYLEKNVNAQRGKNVYSTSIRALRTLNTLGYGRENSGRLLNLMFNPQGPVLPPPQQQLEKDYRNYLAKHYGIVFNQLFVLANMPINRFGSTLISKGEFDSYMTLLRGAFQPENLQNLMCRGTISIDWQGHIYDCDFNQMLNLPITDHKQQKFHISTLKDKALHNKQVQVADHCYGCTAGQGSSCGGALDRQAL